jgi:hypothetical protein
MKGLFMRDFLNLGMQFFADEATGEAVEAAAPQVPTAVAEATNTGTGESAAAVDSGVPAPATQTQPKETDAQFAAARREAEKQRDTAISELTGGKVTNYEQYKRNKLEVKPPVNIELSPAEKAIAQGVYDATYRELSDEGNTESVAKRLAKVEADTRAGELISAKRLQVEQEHSAISKQLDMIVRANPDFTKNGEVNIPDEVMEGIKKYIDLGLADEKHPFAAYKLFEAEQTGKLTNSKVLELEAKIAAMNSNTSAAEATTGSISSETAAEKDFYTSEEWSALPMDTRQKFIRNGTFDKCAAKWK